MKAGETNSSMPETIDRRRFLAGSATISAAIVVSGSALIHAGEAWGLEVNSLKPGTMLTLVKIARDIYPHDRLTDKYYAIAVKGYDKKSADNPAVKAMIEDSVTLIDGIAKARHGVTYAEIGWEEPRVAILKEIEAGPFFLMIRSGLVVGLYNQKEIWPLFGYEGESASEGGYLHRGFNDLTWL
ncbi:Twin-arginine translocation pathway signal (plasmid) [Methylocella tundrae]|uniref:Twin-arginine translocation pathway signal n=2 Tax=Methylocella tundrae TaxID=227605 RepID=A0A4U8Z7R1_METTU|nr:Twin-arginine translocation pathway signal [Methylocella tundrae]